MSHESERFILPAAMLPEDVRSSKSRKMVIRKRGANTEEALKLLALFEATQNIFEDDLERILREDSNG
ncbi:hypothetical protein [Bradyrhizobium sp. USDA 4452]